MKRLVLSSALVAAIALPTSLSAQLDVKTSPVPRYHLVQVSVESTEVAPVEFKSKTEAIRDCGDASALAESLDADFTRNRSLLSTRLPDELREILKDLPVGHATPVFTDSGKVLRVLVLCNRA